MHSFYLCRSWKRKKDWQLDCLFTLLGFASIKAVCRTFMKLSLDRRRNHGLAGRIHSRRFRHHRPWKFGVKHAKVTTRARFQQCCFYACRSQKWKVTDDLAVFCAFGIYRHKSCAKNVGEIDPCDLWASFNAEILFLVCFLTKIKSKLIND